jgi:hypothetical protein
MKNSNVRTRTATSTAATTKTALSSSVVVTTGISSAAIGLWAAACFVSALINSGPLGLIQGWFSAVAGF